MNKISFYERGNLEIIIGSGMHKFPYHSHNSFLVGAVLSGSGKFCINGKTTALCERGLYIVPSDTGISIEPIRDFSYLTICLKNQLAADMKSLKIARYYYSGLENEFYELINRLSSQQLDEQSFVHGLIHLLELRTSCCKNTLKSASILHAVEYLTLHCENKFKLDELSSAVYVSKYHLERLFKREMGVTPKQYHQQCKVRRLKSLLSSSQISSIAYALSFNTQSHLSYVFKRYMGISVKTYIASCRNNN